MQSTEGVTIPDLTISDILFYNTLFYYINTSAGFYVCIHLVNGCTFLTDILFIQFLILIKPSSS